MMETYNKGNSNAQWGMFASGLALGTIIGVGVALLLAPHSGEETRSMIGEKSTDLKDQISGKVNEVTEEVTGKVNEVRGQAEKQIESMKH
jgi:gas vesicle protein